jgi:hypothetical protein
MTNFVDILSTPIEQVKPSFVRLPVGQYDALIEGMPSEQTIGANETPAVVFNLRLLSPINVDMDDLYEALNGRSLNDIPLRYTHWLNGNGLFRLKIFLCDHLGIKPTGNLRQMLPEASGKQFVATITHKAGRDGEIMANVTGTARSSSLAA